MRRGGQENQVKPQEVQLSRHAEPKNRLKSRLREMGRKEVRVSMIKKQ